MRTTRPWGMGIGFAVVLGSTQLSAQAPSSTMSREVVSATGCVQLAGGDGHGDGLGTGFVLKGVRIAPAVGLVEAPRTPAAGSPSSFEASPAPGTAEPASGAADRAGRDPGLLLAADRGVDLSTHVGHRVLVTGRLSSFAAAGGVASTSSGRTLTVTSVSLIAPACTTGL